MQNADARQKTRPPNDTAPDTDTPTEMTAPTERVFRVTEQNIEDFINELAVRGRSHITVRKYNRVLRKMYNYLPDDKNLRKGVFETELPRVKKRYNYSVSTINSAISAFNEFVRFMDYGDFCVDHIEGDGAETPNLSREEYHRLLETARKLDDRRGYVLVKLFANADVRVHDMPAITVEAVRNGVLVKPNSDPVHLCAILRKDLLGYASEKEIRSGYIFRTNRNTPIARHAVTKQISAIGLAAGFPEGYITPRSLQKFYANRLDTVRRTYEPVIESAYDAILETEQHTLAWKD